MSIQGVAALARDLDGTFSIEQVIIDDPQGAEILIEVRAVGLCHSDLHLASSNMGIPGPLLLGHEVSGVVIGLGEQATGLAIGDRVLATLIQYCSRCASCLSGEPYKCVRREATLRPAGAAPRISVDGQPVTQMFGVGGFASHTLVHQNQVVIIPEDLPFAQAAVMACSTLTGAGAVLNSAGVRPGDSVAVIGAGGIGLNAINAAALAGASNIVAVDLSEQKLQLAKGFGATHTINGATGNPVEIIHQLLGGVDHAFEMIGLAPTSLQAIRMTKPGGHAYLVGLHKPGGELVLDAMVDVIMPQRSLHGIYMGSSSPQRDVPRYAAHYAAGRLNLDALVASEIALEAINDGFAALAAGQGVARSVVTSF